MTTCFYAVNNPANPLSQLYTTTRSQEYETWLKLIPDFHEDSEVYAEQCTIRVGQSTRTTLSIFLALHRLTTDLPQLFEVIKTHWHLDFPRLIAIDGALSKLGEETKPEVMAELDSKIAKYLTPRTANQLLPSATHIAQRVRQLVQQFDDRISAKDPRPTRRVTKSQESANTSSLTIEAPHEEIEAANDCVKATAKEHNITRAEAILKILTGDLPAKLVTTTLALYSAKDVEGAPAFLQGVGWVGPETVERLKEGAKIVDMDVAATAETDSYRPTEAIRMYVEGRDGTCRWPGCSVPAENCQLDHRHNFDEGGPTSPSNLYCLCQHHHNVKTDTRAMYIVDPVSDLTYWLFEDGSWVAVDAEAGPIGKGSKRWLQTFAQKIEARRRNSQDQAHKQKEEIDEWYQQQEEAAKREQEYQDLMDELWVDDVKLAQNWFEEGDFSKPFPQFINPNVFMLIEAAHRMGLEINPDNNIDGWVRVHKLIAEAEDAEIERRIQGVADALKDWVPAEKLHEFKRQAAKACRKSHEWKRDWMPHAEKDATSDEEVPF